MGLSQESPKAILGRLGLSARKTLGQHFLVGQGVVTIIVKAVGVQPQDTLVEVGPGLGVVTRRLICSAKHVIAVELDQDLASVLEQELGRASNLRVVCADARLVDASELTEHEPYKLVANLPYYAASPIIRRFLESSHPPVLAVVMVQREVAKNMVAQPGAMSLMSIGIQMYGRPRIVAYVPPSAFYPQPKVSSAVVRIDVYPEPALDLDDMGSFFRMVRAGFSAPRKQLRNALAHGLGISHNEAIMLLEAAEIEPARRAATLSLEEWGGLYREVQKGFVRVDTGARQD